MIHPNMMTAFPWGNLSFLMELIEIVCREIPTMFFSGRAAMRSVLKKCAEDLNGALWN